MIFFFKPSTMHLDCFTDRPDVYEYFPIEKGNKCYPNWWKNLPDKQTFDIENMKVNKTMKTCVGFLDFHTKSICMKLWSDLAIRITNDEKTGLKNWAYQFSDRHSKIDIHGVEQFEGYVKNYFQHFKIISPWIFNCKEDISWVYVGNNWSEDLCNEMHIVPGVVDFKYQGNTQINFFLKLSGNSTFKIFKHNTPLINMFPMTEKKIKIHNHLITSEELNNKKKKSVSVSFSKKYYKIRNILKKQKEESKCPFGFK